jgi:hypothetical protein
MFLIPRVLLRWIVPAGAVTACCVLTCLCAQQVYRQLANDPQIQMAWDIAAQLEHGADPSAAVPAAPVELSRSLAPFVMVLDDSGAVVASSARLRGQLRTPPAGVADFVREHGEERVTWQPEPGVRVATVAVRYSRGAGGVVIVGRSLEETERRIARFGSLVLIGWLCALAALLVLVAGSEYAIGK